MTDELRQAYAERFGVEAPQLAELDDPGGLSALLGRATCRQYTPAPVPEPLLDALLACAQSAPSKSDLQQYSIIVVERPEARREIAGWLPNMPWVAKAPVFLVFCGDVRRNRRACEYQQRPHANDNLDTFFNATVDAALAMGAFVQSAEQAGLGCCPISYVRNRLPEISELLNLPPGVFPVAGLCVGWPAAAAPVSMRLPPKLVVHRDRYDDADFEAELRAYDARRHERQPLAPAKQKNADVYGTRDHCTWSDQVSRQLSLPERPDFRSFLNDHGLALD